MRRSIDSTRFAAIVGKYVFLVVGCVVVVLPIWFMIVASFRPLSVLMEYPPKLWPDDGTLENYATLLDPDRHPFFRWYLNSVVYAGGVTAGTLAICSLAGYAFAKKEFVGKKVLFLLAMSTMMVPFSVKLIPLFILVRSFRLINTFGGMILPLIAAPIGLFLMRQFMMTIPSSLEESARMDGCPEIRIYWNIILPITMPAVAVLGIFTFMNQWNNLLWPLVVTNQEITKTLTVAIAGFRTQASVSWGLTMAASVLSFIPILIVFLFARERFIEGLTAGALKG
jgi:multiple sugar transport system permease protein